MLDHDAQPRRDEDDDDDDDDNIALARRYGERLRGDPELLASLGLRLDVANIIDFGPIALSRITAAHDRESNERKRLEAMARANFAAQAQTHAAVVDMLESRNHADLARRIDDMARLRFGLAAGVVALEGSGAAPPGWNALVDGQVDLILGPSRLARMGVAPTALGLFGHLAPVIGSMALVRLAIGDPARQGVVAFGSVDVDSFTADMGEELVSFLARVLERTAERWPLP